MAATDEIINEKLRAIILLSASQSFGKLIEKDPHFLEAPLFRSFVDKTVDNICKSLRRAFVIG